MKDAPLWIRGGLGKDRIIIASPLNPPKGSDKSGIKDNNIPSLKDLDTREDFALFFNRNGYQYSYTIVEAIVNLYDYESLRNLIKSSCDFMNTFKITECEFQNRWINFINENYK